MTDCLHSRDQCGLFLLEETILPSGRAVFRLISGENKVTFKKTASGAFMLAFVYSIIFESCNVSPWLSLRVYRTPFLTLLVASLTDRFRYVMLSLYPCLPFLK